MIYLAIGIYYIPMIEYKCEQLYHGEYLEKTNTNALIPYALSI